MKTKTQANGGKQHEHPGRPRFQPKFPRAKEWTFTDLMEANQVETNPDNKQYGKGPDCTMLTLRKFVARDAAKMGRSQIFRIRGVTAEPNSKAGLGRRGYLYSLRASATKVKTAKAVKSAPAVKTPKAPKTTAGLSPATQQYEDIKAILAAPSPVLPATEPASAVIISAVDILPETLPVPVLDPAPVLPATEPASAVSAPATS